MPEFLSFSLVNIGVVAFGHEGSPWIFSPAESLLHVKHKILALGVVTVLFFTW